MNEEKLNEFRKVDLKVFCPGVNPGEKIETELNPIINWLLYSGLISLSIVGWYDTDHIA